MDLFNVSEIKRLKDGAVEIKFFDRIRALEKIQSMDFVSTEQSISFYSAIQKYGWDNIQHIVLLQGLSKEVACECERYLITNSGTITPRSGYVVQNGSEVISGTIF